MKGYKLGKQVDVKVGKFAAGGFVKSFASGFNAGGKIKEDADWARAKKDWMDRQKPTAAPESSSGPEMAQDYDASPAKSTSTEMAQDYDDK